MKRNWAALIADLKGLGEMSDADIADAVGNDFSKSAVRWIRKNPHTVPRHETAMKLLAIHKRVMRNRARAA